MWSARNILRERWKLCVLQAERDTLFVELHTEVTEEEVQAAAHVACSAPATPPPWSIPRHHEHEAGISTYGVVNKANSSEEK